MMGQTSQMMTKNYLKAWSQRRLLKETCVNSNQIQYWQEEEMELSRWLRLRRIISLFTDRYLIEQ